MKKVPLFRIKIGPFVIEAVKKSAELTDEEKAEIVNRLVLDGERFLVDPLQRDILILPKRR